MVPFSCLFVTSNSVGEVTGTARIPDSMRSLVNQLKAVTIGRDTAAETISLPVRPGFGASDYI